MDVLVAYLPEILKSGNILKITVVTNIQEGLSEILVIVIAHISDTWTGRFKMILYSTNAYVIGLWALYTLAGLDNAALVMYLAMAPLSMGVAGRHHPIDAFLGDQMRAKEPDQTNIDEGQVEDRTKFWSNLSEVLGWGVALLVAFGFQTWGGIFLVSGIAMTVGGFLFFAGLSCYSYQDPTGSPLADLYHVCNAARFKSRLVYPSTAEQFYHNDKDEIEILPHVAVLRWLDKASVIDQGTSTTMISSEEQERKGTLYPVAKVREVKLLLSMAPMCATFLFNGLVVATGSTFFILQKRNMDNRVGRLQVPIVFFTFIRSVSSSVASFLYERLIQKLHLWTCATEQNSNRAWKMKIGLGLFFSLLSCLAALVVEYRRLNLFKEEFKKSTFFNEEDEIIVPMSIFWLTPQFCLLGIMDGLCEGGFLDFYHSLRATESTTNTLRSYRPMFNQLLLGMGKFLATLWMLMFKHWFGETINDCRLDKYYGVIALLSLANGGLYGFMSNMPMYNIVVVPGEDAKSESESKSKSELEEIVVVTNGDKNSVPSTSCSRSSSTSSTHGLKFRHQRALGTQDSLLKEPESSSPPPSPPSSPTSTSSTRRIATSSSFPKHQSHKGRTTGLNFRRLKTTGNDVQ